MKSIILSTFFTLATANIVAQQSAPTFIKFNHDDYSIPEAVSDNGEWVLVYGATEEQRNSSGYRLYQVSTGQEIVVESPNSSCYITDVSNDGNIVAGMYDNMPAYLNRSTGEWTKLPIPDNCVSGHIKCMTPDAKYAVGECDYNIEGWSFCGGYWDLTTGEYIELSNLPPLNKEDEGDFDQMRFNYISSDGRYIAINTEYSYGTQRNMIYDTSNNTYVTMGYESDHTTHLKLFKYLTTSEELTISNNGKYAAFTARMYDENSDYVEKCFPVLYDVENNTYQLFNATEDADRGARGVDNEGNLYAASPYVSSPQRSMSIRHGNFWYDLDQIIQQVYGIDYYDKTSYDYTGTPMPMGISDDGKTLSVMVSPLGEGYILTLPESLPNSCDGINLLENYTITPAEGSTLSSIFILKVTFGSDITVLGSSSCIKIYSPSNEELGSSVGVAVESLNSKTLYITFRSSKVTLTAGEDFRVNIPEGTVALTADDSQTNKEINITYHTRAKEPVKPLNIYPNDSTYIGKIDNDSNPIYLMMDAQVEISEEASATLIRQDDGETICSLNFVASDTIVAIYPSSTQYLYDGVTYNVVVKQGSITDLSGDTTTGMEELTLTYFGSYERVIDTNDSTLFTDDFSDVSSSLSLWLRYEGDHNTPTEEMLNMEFDQDNQPWNFSIRDEDSSDYCAGSHSMYNPSGQSDDWMLTPQISISGEDCILSFDAQSYREGKHDTLRVIIWSSEENLNYLDDSHINDIKNQGDIIFCEELNTGGSEDMLEDEWTRYSFDLSNYNGKNIYVCFWNNNTDQSMIFVDNVMIKRSTKYLLSLTNADVVVNLTSIDIAGTLTISSDIDTFNDVSITLMDGGSNEISTFYASGSFSKDDKVSFYFDNPLPLTVGEKNDFTLKVQLDDYSDLVESSVKSLTFEPTKRVILEEFTGTDCPNCPLGMLAIENLKNLYGDLFLPISIYSYGQLFTTSLMTSYSSYLGLYAAPTGIIQRSGEIVSPMGQDSKTGDYIFSNGSDLWLDHVRSEMEIPADFDISSTGIIVDKNVKTITLPLTIVPALNLTGLNLNVLIVAVEDGLTGYQQNNLYATTDENLGAWGKGGANASSIVYNISHKNVARYVWGSSFNGTSGLFSQSMVAGQEYTTTLNMALPDIIVDELDKCRLIAIIINGNNDKVINALNVPFPEYDGIIGNVASQDNAPQIEAQGDGFIIISNSFTTVSLYTITGTTLTSIKGEGTLQLKSNGYRGTVIIKATNNFGTTVKKFQLK